MQLLQTGIISLASGSLILTHVNDLRAWQLKRFTLARLSKSLGRSTVEVASAEFGVLKVEGERGQVERQAKSASLARRYAG